MDAFLPEKPTIKETLSGVEIEGVEYLAATDLSDEQKEGRTVQDVVLLGEVTSPNSDLGVFLMIELIIVRDIPRGDNFVFSVV